MVWLKIEYQRTPSVLHFPLRVCQDHKDESTNAQEWSNDQPYEGGLEIGKGIKGCLLLVFYIQIHK